MRVQRGKTRIQRVEEVDRQGKDEDPECYESGSPGQIWRSRVLWEWIRRAKTRIQSVLWKWIRKAQTRTRSVKNVDLQGKCCLYNIYHSKTGSNPYNEIYWFFFWYSLCVYYLLPFLLGQGYISWVLSLNDWVGFHFMTCIQCWISSKP